MNKNFLANIIGKFWSTLSNVIFLPIYIALLGIDNYAVISFALIVTGVLTILDVGLSATIAREMARTDVADTDKYSTAQTIEKIYLLMLIICALAGLLLATPVATHFINNSPISRDLIALCLKIIAIEAGLQLLFRFYVSAMMGLERQVAANMFNIGWGIARNALVILPLLFWPSLFNFFVWQLGASFVLLVIARRYLGRLLIAWRPATVPFFDWSAIARVRGFALGIFLISIMAVVNTQLDRIVLSRLLALEYLGYYNIAVSIGTGMLVVSSPFITSILPRLTQYYSDDRSADARDLYGRVTTIVAFLAFPLMAVIGLNAELVVFTWTGNVAIAHQTAPIVPWVVASYTLLSMSTMTYGVALANGFTRYNNIIGVLTLCVSIPGYWLAVGSYGAVGAAALFLAIQFCVSTSFQILVDRRFLHLGFVRSYLQLFVGPAVVSLAIAAPLQWLMPVPQQSRLLMLVYLGFAYGVSFIVVAAAITALFRLRWQWSDLTSQGTNDHT
jgi:O-antigen/teichoic acid export membrane protein